MSYTPGPWRKSFKSKATNNLGVYGPNGALLASLDVHQLAPESVVSRRAADARLIAAAPDLLKACAATLAGYPGWQTMIQEAHDKATGV